MKTRSFGVAGNLPWTRELAENATLRLPPGRSGVVVRVERGSLLVTQEGDPEDHVLGPGDEVRLPRGGLAVAWALAATRLVAGEAAAEPRFVSPGPARAA